ncbi:MAG: GNAT family N-acetyltransferase [Candidatus Thorarchaeota archaeon]|jgi:ribosomal protein S18 acetylase RimI-like enzyme
MMANAEEALELAAGWWENKEVPKYVHVRLIERDDIPEFVDLYNRCFLASPDPFRLLTIEEAENLDFEGVFVADMWENLAGFIACFVEKDGDSKYGEITGIGVLPNRRRKGVATALIRQASEYFIDADIDEIYCEVFEENTPSKMLIQAYGFKEVGKRAIPGMVATPEQADDVPSGGKIMRRLGLRPRGT